MGNWSTIPACTRFLLNLLKSAEIVMAELNRKELLLAIIPGRGPAYLRGIDLSGLQLTGVRWLREADMRYAELTEVSLKDCDLFQCDLRQARLCRANLAGADLDRKSVV